MRGCDPRRKHLRHSDTPAWVRRFHERWDASPFMEGPADRRGKAPKIPAPPPPTAEETALQQEQVGLLRMQRDALERKQKQQEQLMPLFYEASGIEPVTDEAGNIISFKRKAPTQAETTSEEILNLQLARSKAALAGELPVDPALISNLDEEEMDLRSFLRQRFGPDYETSTPAQQALGDFSQRKLEILDSARRGDLTMAEGLSLARQGSQERQTSLFMERGAGTASLVGGTAGAFGGAAAGYGEPISFLRNQRLLEYQAAAQNSMNRANFQNQLIGTGVSVGLGALGGAFLGPDVGMSAIGGAAVGAGGGLGTLPFLSMKKGTA